jgi:hypothetical protein
MHDLAPRFGPEVVRSLLGRLAYPIQKTDNIHSDDIMPGCDAQHEVAVLTITNTSVEASCRRKSTASEEYDTELGVRQVQPSRNTSGGQRRRWEAPVEWLETLADDFGDAIGESGVRIRLKRG